MVNKTTPHYTVEFVFSLAVMLTLTSVQAQRTWYQVSGLFRGIEWNSLCEVLRNKHSKLFNLEELEELSGDKRSREEAVKSALRRNGRAVLHAFYQSLRDTRDCNGAAQHASIAEEIEKQSECECSCIYLPICH